jgi:16S rRNA (cytosine1402-N4)-methyltransferase
MLPSVLPTETDHVPVLAGEVVAGLAPAPGDTIVDGTFGAGGHAALLANRLRGDGKVIAIDRDETVSPYFERFRRESGVKARLLHGEFSSVLAQLAGNGVRADAVLLDLGVSSMQLDRPERGFSYAVDAPLDMRMDPSSEYSARELVNDASERDLSDIFRRYGEERYARPIARAIVRQRTQQPYERTGELVHTIKSAIPAPAGGEGHPAKACSALDRGQRQARRPRALPAGARLLRPVAVWRSSVPLARGPHRQQFLRAEPRLHRRPTSQCVCGNRRYRRTAPRDPVRRRRRSPGTRARSRLD